jgi:hypothetical protein
MSDQEPPGGSARGSLPLGRATDEEEPDEPSDEEDVNELLSAQLNPVHITKVAYKNILLDSSDDDSDIEVLETQFNVPRRKSVENTLSNTNDRPGRNLPPGAFYCCSAEDCFQTTTAAKGIVQKSGFMHKCQGCREVMHGGTCAYKEVDGKLWCFPCGRGIGKKNGRGNGKERNPIVANVPADGTSESPSSSSQVDTPIPYHSSDDSDEDDVDFHDSPCCRVHYVVVIDEGRLVGVVTMYSYFNNTCVRYWEKIYTCVKSIEMCRRGSCIDCQNSRTPVICILTSDGVGGGFAKWPLPPLQKTPHRF